MALVDIAGAAKNVDDHREERAKEDDEGNAELCRRPKNNRRRYPGQRRNWSQYFKRRKGKMVKRSIHGHCKAKRNTNNLRRKESNEDSRVAGRPIVPKFPAADNLSERNNDFAGSRHRRKERNLQAATQFPKHKYAQNRD